MGKSKRQVEFGWFIPTTGDGKYIGVEPERKSTADYMVQVAQTAERAGFTFALIPTGGACLDSWIVGTTIAAHTQVLKPLVAMRPGLIAPVLAARMAASLDQVSGGRALINVVTGGSPQDLLATGDPLAHDHDGRYERTREFLEIVKSVWTNSHARFWRAIRPPSRGRSRCTIPGATTRSREEQACRPLCSIPIRRSTMEEARLRANGLPCRPPTST